MEEVQVVEESKKHFFTAIFDGFIFLTISITIYRIFVILLGSIHFFFFPSLNLIESNQAQTKDKSGFD